MELIEKTSLAVDPLGFESIGRDDETLSVLKVKSIQCKCLAGYGCGEIDFCLLW